MGYQFIDDVKVAKELGLASKYARKAHIHVLDGKPLIGATTAKSIIGSKDNLMQWYADMAAVAALNCPQCDIKAEYEAIQALTDKDERRKAKEALDEKYPDYAESRRAAINHRDEKAEEGTERHGMFEEYVKSCIETNRGVPLAHSVNEPDSISKFVDWALENVQQFIFSEAYCYDEDMFVGGIADVGMVLKSGQRVVGDHKSAKEAYPEMFLQTAIYDLLLAKNGILDKHGNKLGEWELADGYVIFPFRSNPFMPEFRWNPDNYRKGAQEAVHLYKLLELQQ